MRFNRLPKQSCPLSLQPNYLRLSLSLPSPFLFSRTSNRNPPTHCLYIYRRNKFQVRFQASSVRGGRREIRARIALLLYRGLVNKLNQIRSALPRNRCFLRLRELQLLALSPRPFFFFMASDGGEKIATIESKEEEGKQKYREPEDIALHLLE